MQHRVGIIGLHEPQNWKPVTERASPQRARTFNAYDWGHLSQSGWVWYNNNRKTVENAAANFWRAQQTDCINRSVCCRLRKILRSRHEAYPRVSESVRVDQQSQHWKHYANISCVLWRAGLMAAQRVGTWSSDFPWAYFVLGGRLLLFKYWDQIRDLTKRRDKLVPIV